ncbi:MAG: parallel beta-helix domain-containing protein [Myxococcota bacterium]
MRTISILALTSGALALLAPACDSSSGDSLPTGCDALIKPGDNDAQELQAAFIDAQSGDTVCLAAGTYAFDRELSLTNAADVTLKGMGATRDDVVLDFATQTVGDDGFTVTATGFTVENLTIKNSPGNGIVAHSETSTFRNIKVWWDAGSVTENGFYAIYPTDCKKVIIEDNEVIGASDAGIYVGSCEYAIVRRNKVHGNVAGLEIENTHHADVYDNEVYDNTAGILALVLPNLKIKDNRYVNLRNNNIHDNNRTGFAKAGTVVSYVPKGIGILSLAGADIEIQHNQIVNNDGAGAMVVSYKTFEILTDKPLDDPQMDPYLRRLYIHDNTFDGNGDHPLGALALLGQATLENVLWDGVTANGETVADAKICLGASPPTFRMFAVADGFAPAKQSTATTDHTCTLESLPEMQDFSGITE